jgi:glycosyltransferase involved in cell wall biosynthesis
LVQGEVTLKRVAFTLIGGRGWMGGLNYQINLLSALVAHQAQRITPILFLGNDIDKELLDKFSSIDGLKIVQSPEFNAQYKFKRLLMSLLVGRDSSALSIFRRHNIDVAFEAANFYGWRFPLKTIAWIPDLQHQRLKHYFSFFAFWKREIGFRMQVYSGRHIMLSSEDAKSDFQHFYRIQPNRLHVVRFAVPIRAVNFDLNRLLAKYDLPELFFYLPNQFWRHKNHECVIRALASANQKGCAITVAASGNPKDPRDPNYFPDLVNLAKSLGVSDQFKILGLIPYEDVQALMRGCAAIINPSRFEGWSTTVEEAKALSVNMLLSDINVHREQAGALALYFDVEDKDTLATLLINHQTKSKTNKNQPSAFVFKQAEENMSKYAASFASMVSNIV